MSDKVQIDAKNIMMGECIQAYKEGRQLIKDFLQAIENSG